MADDQESARQAVIEASIGYAPEIATMLALKDRQLATREGRAVG